MSPALPGLEDLTQSPMRRQYLAAKRRHPDAILLFRLGDFYETFDNDADVASRELEIALTARDMGRGERVPMAGIPHHSAEGYIARLLAKGYRVALCEQLGEPGPGKGMLERQVVRVITPGTLVEDSLLQSAQNNFLASLAADGEAYGLAHADISTGLFSATEIRGPNAGASLSAELSRLAPAELLIASEADQRAGPPEAATVTRRDASWFSSARAARVVIQQFGPGSLDEQGLGSSPLAAAAVAALIEYVRETQPTALAALQHVSLYSVSGHMLLDAAARRSLELLAGMRSGSREGSLLEVLDRTSTAMGARRLRAWLARPLLDVASIQKRLDNVEHLTKAPKARRQLAQSLHRMPDLERLAARTAQKLLTPRECLALANGLSAVGHLAELQSAADLHPLRDHLRSLNPCLEAQAEIRGALKDEPPAELREGVIREGFSQELDELRALRSGAVDWIKALERSERERTGVRQLRVGYNRVFGYYLELSTAAMAQPTDYYQRQQSGADTLGQHLEHLGYTRRQTLANAERFVTQELKEHERRAEHAQEEAERLERRLYDELLERLARWAPQIQTSASRISRLDGWLSLAEVATQHSYARPEIDEGTAIRVVGGRHPVVEASLAPGEFVANDVELSTDRDQIMVLTGPNMAGKSTYLRQVALLAILAQMGSFVPAASARVGVVDRIFTRIGAQDELAAGRSTFMVEMSEVAGILRSATPRSLVILDEVGRGTSTYDGVAIAQAVVEHLHNAPGLGCKTLFATHYHELAELAEQLQRVVAYRMEVREQAGSVVFLHRVAPGGADRSYGIYVARLAGVPETVTSRALNVLAHLEAQRRRSEADGHPAGAPTSKFEQAGAPEILKQISQLKLDEMSPLEGLATLFRLQKQASELGREY